MCLVAGYQALLGSSVFRLTKVRMNGLARLDQGQAMTIMGVGPGASLLKIDTEALRLRLLTSPWVAAAQVRRIWPDELHVEVVERRPQAVVMTGRPWYVDETGLVFKTIAPGEAPDLPVITGIREESLGAPQTRQKLQTALRLIEALATPGAPLGLAQLSEIRLSASQGLVIHPLAAPGGGRAPKIILGHKLGEKEIQEKFRRWRVVMNDLEIRRQWRRVEYLDLRVDERVYVGL